ncbi:hypothetical protein DL93DRAFT_781478 [Clavulina sp. PMI_390]|nr:hypothetical protein DL93DRAFT_781478 [Clavulina sp. PMI_390]
MTNEVSSELSSRTNSSTIHITHPLFDITPPGGYQRQMNNELSLLAANRGPPCISTNSSLKSIRLRESPGYHPYQRPFDRTPVKISHSPSPVTNAPSDAALTGSRSSQLGSIGGSPKASGSTNRSLPQYSRKKATTSSPIRSKLKEGGGRAEQAVNSLPRTPLSGQAPEHQLDPLPLVSPSKSPRARYAPSSPSPRPRRSGKKVSTPSRMGPLVEEDEDVEAGRNGASAD